MKPIQAQEEHVYAGVSATTAKQFILDNYFDGDDNANAVTHGDMEHMAMKKAVDALELLEKIMAVV